MSKKYLFVGEHAETLDGGQRFGPGDEVPASAVNPDTVTDQRLLEEGVLIEPQAARQATNDEEKS